jgi:cell division protein FtsB
LKLFSKIPSWLLNKYLLASVFFIVWMAFFDLKDFGTVYNLRAKLKNLQKKEQHMNTVITNTYKELDLLKTSAQTIEKYAREKYMMKKDNEDLFVINPAPQNN